MKKNTLAIITVAMMIGMCTPVYAGTWSEIMNTTETGEQIASGDWIYLDKDGNRTINDWAKDSVGQWYYLGNDGLMVRNKKIEDNGEYYYFNDSGVMVKNQWVQLEREDDSFGDGLSESLTDGLTDYYYFGDTGKAYRNKSGEKACIKEINEKKYVFDEEGRVLYGWITEDGYGVDRDDDYAWQDAVYFCDLHDASLSVGWKTIKVIDENSDGDDVEKNYKFYFRTNGKKTVDAEKTITSEDGTKGKYRFNEYGAMTSSKMLTKTVTNTDGTQTMQSSYYNKKGSKVKEQWINKIPSASQSEEDHDNEIKRWYYSDKSGNIVKNQIKKIDGKYYCFDEFGIRREGLIAVKDGVYQYIINNTTEIYDIWGSIEDVRNAADAGYDIMYFKESSGVRENGSCTIELDDEKCKFKFGSNGIGLTGAHGGYLYHGGLLLRADKDDEGRVREYEVNGEIYTVNTSGKIQ